MRSTKCILQFVQSRFRIKTGCSINHERDDDKTGKRFKAEFPATRKFINSRIKEGYTREDFIRVIDLKTKHWLNNRELNAFLRSSTLFNSTNFEKYLNELVAVKKPRRQPSAPPVLTFRNGGSNL